MELVAKGSNISLCKGLSSKEFDCQCTRDDCLVTPIREKFLKAYEALRTLVNVPLKINSGYRCPAHNKAVGGRPLSRHQLGQAVDICKSSLSHLNDEEIEHAARMSGFTFVMMYGSFVHLDVREI